MVTLKRTAKELASWGHRVVVVLSRYIPSSSTQNASLNFCFSAVALRVYVEERELRLSCDAREDAVVKTLAMIIRHAGRI